MAIILTGGTGKTSRRIARLLQDAKIQFLLLSRNGETGASGMPAAKFDWTDNSTFEVPFEYKFENNEKISAVYLVAPEVAQPDIPMNAFIDLAVQKYNVKRFVLLSSTGLTKDTPYHVGPVWKHIADIGVEYCVLCPTWFMENFSERQHYLPIKNEDKIYSACQDGKIPFIGVSDIAAMAFKALTDEKSYDTGFQVLGPESLTHDQVTEKLSKVLGRKITNVKLTEEESVQRYQSLKYSDLYATLLAQLEAAAATGREDQEDHSFETVVGRRPQSFDDWLEENKHAWD